MPHNKSGCKITTFFSITQAKNTFFIKNQFFYLSTPSYTPPHTTLYNPTPYYITRAHARETTLLPADV